MSKAKSKPVIRRFVSPTTFTSKKYPPFIRQHPILNQDPKIQKIFPLIGLKDQSIPLSKVLDSSYKTEYPTLKNPKYQVVFSSSSWDIATMSMRGIDSCQRWGNNDHCKHLIGSILDPCCAIIYLTDGTTTRCGPKTLVRSVVRFVVKRDNRQQQIIAIDYPYCSNTFENDNKIPTYGAAKDIIQEAFSNAIEQMLGKGKIRVETFAGQDDYQDSAKYCIPYSPTHQAGLGPSKYSYRDTPFPYWFIKASRFPKAAQKIGWGDGSEECCEMSDEIW